MTQAQAVFLYAVVQLIYKMPQVIKLLLQQTVFKFLTVGLGWTLLSCAPAISLLFAKAEGEKINIVTISLTFLTIFGVLIVLNA